MNDCFSDDGLHDAIDTPVWYDDDELETGGLICRYCGVVLE